MSESKKLKEVWDWKENVYEKTKNMTRRERVKFFNQGLRDFIKRNRLGLIIEKSSSHPEQKI